MHSDPLPSHAGPDSGPLLGAPITELPFDPVEVDDLSDAELDALMHGVIALDGRGRILRYNLAEASLARLDRHSVIGRMFFDEVAPCTKTDAFFGAFSRMVETGQDRVQRFGYLFDFKFGAQECDVEMVRAKDAKRYYVFVTRRAFAEPRSGLPDGWAAPLQSELDPVGQASGVVRDGAEQRVALVDGDFIATLLTTAQELHPVEWPALAYRWGERWGRRWAVGLEMSALQEQASSLKEIPFADSMKRIKLRLAESGWGSLSVNTQHLMSGVLVVDLQRSLIAELVATGRAGARAGAEAILEGLLGAAFTHLAGRRLGAVSIPTEEESTSRFLIVGENFRAVTTAIAASTSSPDLNGVISVLRAAQAVVK